MDAALSEFYDRFYHLTEHSAAHAEFCRQVYGADFCQHGMLTTHQLEVLLTHINDRRPHMRMLDIGCGNGRITTYIAEKTRAHVTGIDFSSKSIKSAQEHATNKRIPLTFITADMMQLPFDAQSFDMIIAIDSLYFIDDLAAAVNQMRRVLTPHGQMAIFFDSWITPDMDPILLQPQHSNLAAILHTYGFAYDTIDFTTENTAHWKKRQQVLSTLKPAFEEEGNMALWEQRMAECTTIRYPTSRYLYLCQLNMITGGTHV